jgi:hypothetical protein
MILISIGNSADVTNDLECAIMLDNKNPLKENLFVQTCCLMNKALISVHVCFSSDKQFNLLCANVHLMPLKRLTNTTVFVTT